MHNVMGALRGCRAVKFDSCNNLLSSVHIILEIILRSQIEYYNENIIILWIYLMRIDCNNFDGARERLTNKKLYPMVCRSLFLNYLLSLSNFLAVAYKLFCLCLA